MNKIYQTSVSSRKTAAEGGFGGSVEKKQKPCKLPRYRAHARCDAPRKGFTLIELLVVVLIVGTLAAVALPQYRKAVARAKTVRMLPLLRSLADAEERHYMANGEYAKDIEALDVNWPDEYLPDGIGVRWSLNSVGVWASYNYRVDMPPIGYYFRYGSAKEGEEPVRKPGRFVCNGYDSDIKTWVCQSLGSPVYEWTPWFTYW